MLPTPNPALAVVFLPGVLPVLHSAFCLLSAGTLPASVPLCLNTCADQALWTSATVSLHDSPQKRGASTQRFPGICSLGAGAGASIVSGFIFAVDL